MNWEPVVDELMKSLGNQLVGNKSKENFKDFMRNRIESISKYETILNTWAECNKLLITITDDVEDLLSDDVEKILTDANNVTEKAKKLEILNVSEIKELMRLNQAVKKCDKVEDIIKPIEEMISKLRITIEGIFIKDFDVNQNM